MERHLSEATEKLLAFLSTRVQAVESTVSLFGAPKDTTRRAVSVEITFLRAPDPHRVPLYIPLPHEVHEGSICLVTPPPQRRYKDIIASAANGEDTTSEAASRVKRVIDSKKLAAKFSEPVTCRALARSYGLFVVHHGVKTFPQQLTGEFLAHQSAPVWLSSKSNFLSSLDAALKTAVLPRRGFVTVGVQVGHTGLPAPQLQANVEALAAALELGDVLSMRLCGTDAGGRRAALPIYAHDYIAAHPELSQPRGEVAASAHPSLLSSSGKTKKNKSAAAVVE